MSKSSNILSTKEFDKRNKRDQKAKNKEGKVDYNEMVEILLILAPKRGILEDPIQYKNTNSDSKASIDYLYEDLFNEKNPTLNNVSLKVVEEKNEPNNIIDLDEELLFDFDIPNEISLEEDPF
mmetsp:Transcript_16771/g.14704  ORF Transcript_16771/g.14704 Transcript_16771/m.14704 type:complete len:123 (+) Transcript_16771:270-638(+)